MLKVVILQCTKIVNVQLFTVVRGRNVRREYRNRLKEHYAAIILQRFIRARAKRKQYLEKRQKIHVFQQGEHSICAVCFCICGMMKDLHCLNVIINYIAYHSLCAHT